MLGRVAVLLVKVQKYTFFRVQNLNAHVSGLNRFIQLNFLTLMYKFKVYATHWILIKRLVVVKSVLCFTNVTLFHQTFHNTTEVIV